MHPHPPRRTALERFGRWTARHARVVAGGWLVLVSLAFALTFGMLGTPGLFERLSSGEPTVPGEAMEGRDLLLSGDGRGPQVLLTLDDVDPADPAVRDLVTRAATRLATDPQVLRVTQPYDERGTLGGPLARSTLAADGRGLLVSVDLRPDLADEQEDAALARVRTALDDVARTARDDLAATARVGGVLLIVDEITHQVEEDLRTGEGVALPVSLLVMVLVFGGFLAAGMPVLGAIASIGGALACLVGFSLAMDLDASVPSVVTVLGLGLSIDYGLLVVSRFREELRADGAPDRPVDASMVEDALGRTVATAGRTVVFSAVTVAISLCGLLFFEADILRAVGAAGVSVVAVALAVAVGLVPALVALAGGRLVRPGLPTRVPGLRRLVQRLGDLAPDHGVFSRLARRVQRHPAIAAVAVLGALVVLTTPATHMQLRSSGVELLPPGAEQRVFFEDLDRRFPAARDPDVTVVVRASPAQVTSYAAELARLPDVVSVGTPRQLGELVAISVVPDGEPGSDAARAVVESIRADRPDQPSWVTGRTAALMDLTASIRASAPWAVGIVALATTMLLFLMTGSVLVPLKALAMNLVSLGASLGAVVWVFQDGHLEGLLGFESTGGLESTIPPLVLAFGFGLSMDYEVFLLARIKELWDRGLPTDDAVALGLQRSGRIITSAALLVVIVFSGFVAGDLLVIKQTGVALATAVAVDATLVRMLLVPATMTLLGDWNWWAPRPLRALHSRIGVRH